MLTALVLASLGQYRACQTAATYRQQATYAAPTYNNAYAAPYVERTAFVYVQPASDYYAALVGGQVRQELAAKAKQEQAAALSDRVNQLAAALDRLTAQIGNGQPQPPPSPGQPIAPGKPQPVPDVPPAPGKPQPNPNPGVAEPPPSPGVDNGNVPPPPAVPPPPGPAGQPNAKVLAILQARCVKCHTDPAKGGKGVILFGADGKLANLGPLDKLMIDQAVYSGDMPKNAEPLPPEEYSAIRAWINEDKDAIEAAIKAQPQGK